MGKQKEPQSNPPTFKVDEQVSYAKAFFVLSALLLAAVVWTFLDEFHIRRP